MLNWLRNTQVGRTPIELLGCWQSMMEESEPRANFFEKVVNQAKLVYHFHLHLTPTLNTC
jgi:hypothetical protein